MDQITIAIPKGRNFKPAVEIFKSIGLDVSVIVEDTRKLLAALPEENVKFLVIRDTDIPTYVEYGAADIGVAGRDVLAEQGRDLYEPLDFKFGFCRMVLAEPKELRAGDAPSKWTHIRVATKFPKITENYFKGKGIQVEIIKLYGSIELALFTINLAVTFIISPTSTSPFSFNVLPVDTRSTILSDKPTRGASSIEP